MIENLKSILYKSRKTSLLYMMILLLFFTVACESSNGGKATGSQGDEQENVKVSYWYWLDDPSDNIIEELIEKFNDEHENITVEGRMVPFNEYQQALINAASSGNTPDAARFKDWWVGQFARSELLEPIDNYVEDWEYAEEVHDQYWESGRTLGDSNVYMLPHSFITFYLYYRADYFKENNLEKPETYEQFLTAAKALTNEKENRYGFGLRGGAGGQDQWYAWMLAGGARMVNEKGEVIINDKKAVEINQEYIDLFREHKVSPPSSPTDSFAQVMGAFEAGITGMAAHHIGSYKGLEELFGDKLGVVPMPAKDLDNPATMGSMSGNSVFKDSEHKDAAWTWISWLTSPEAMDAITHSTNGQLPVLDSIASDPELRESEGWEVAIDSGEFTYVWPGLPGVAPVAGHIWTELMSQALLGDITSKEMLDGIAEALQKEE